VTSASVVPQPGSSKPGISVAVAARFRMRMVSVYLLLDAIPVLQAVGAARRPSSTDRVTRRNAPWSL
jgi:hypothetical protein